MNLLDESTFETGGGLWTGKKGPFATATVIRNTNFTGSGRVDYSDVAVLEVEAKQLAKRRLASGDIIVERSGGGPNQPVGRVVFFDRDEGVFSHSNFTSRLRVIDAERFLPKFVFYFLLYFHDSKQTDHLQRRTTGIRNLDWQAYRESAAVPLFALAEQRQIAAVLSAVQRAIERQERLIALTAELKKALMHKLFTEGTRREPLKQTEIGPVPKSWKVQPLRGFCAIKHGYAFDGNYFGAEGERVLMTPGHFHEDGGFRDQGERTKFYVGEIPAGYTLAPNDLLVAMTEQKAGLLGTAALVPADGVYLHNQRLGLITSLRGEKLNKYFLYHWFNRSEVKTRIASTATGSKVRHTSPGKILDVNIAVPSIQEQLLVVDALDTVDRKRKIHEQILNGLSTLFRSLLHGLMTAQLRVHDLDLSSLGIEEPAGAV